MQGAKFYVYEDKAGKWRWQLVGANNSDIIADSGQGYASEAYCRSRVTWIKQSTHLIPVLKGYLQS